jgi:hypothetical protein
MIGQLFSDWQEERLAPHVLERTCRHRVQNIDFVLKNFSGLPLRFKLTVRYWRADNSKDADKAPLSS